VLEGLTGSLISDFYAYTDRSRIAPVRVAAWDLDGDGIADRIVTAQGTDGKTRQLRCFNLSGQLVDQYLESDPSFYGMYNLAVAYHR
jgi:hypothetical protein